jgi:hypothetical protein
LTKAKNQLLKSSITVRICLFAFLPFSLFAQLNVKLSPDTLREFEKYVAASEASMGKRWKGEVPFLLIDENKQERAKVLGGEISIRQMTPKGGQKIASGIIHEWAGTEFLKGATLQQATAIVTDFDRHKQLYPEVVDSKLLSKNGEVVRGFHRIMKKKVLTVVLLAEYEVKTHQLGPNRAYTISHSTKIAEVDDVGTKTERELPGGEGHGFLWRLNAYWRFEATNQGVLAECQAITLTRDVPAGLGWIVNPFIHDMPRESLRSLLESTRTALAH